MLECERRGEPYNKSAHRRRLLQILRGRSETAIEFKHANISAVLLDGGFPRYIDGYKPRSNYQALLRQSVLDHLAANRELIAATARVAIAPALEVPALRPLTDILVAAPVLERRSDRTYERPVAPPTPLLGINYLEREARNASLGEAGEAFVLQVFVLSGSLRQSCILDPIAYRASLA